ncbi:hypothetical protein O0544_18145 [Edwardsiella anguillarum]|nr:hypothetical protein [Edwardsiella anguillarum]
MDTLLHGNVWKFGDNINTDIISPPQYMELSIAEAAPYCMSAVNPHFAAQVRPGIFWWPAITRAPARRAKPRRSPSGTGDPGGGGLLLRPDFLP